MENINQSSVSKGFSEYFKNPEGIDISDKRTIETLIEKFPYAQMLHAFDAKCHYEGNESDKYLEKAALYIPERNALYDIIHRPENFRPGIEEKTEIIAEESAMVYENDAEPIVQKNYNEYNHLASSTQQPESDTAETKDFDALEEIKVDDEISETVNPAAPSDLEENELVEEESEVEPEITEASGREASISVDDEQPVAEETEVVKGTINEHSAADNPSPEEHSYQASEVEDETIVAEDQAEHVKPSDETEKLILGNIAASDFFRFEEKLDDQMTPHQGNEHASEATKTEVSDSANGVSKYDDDKMPYTFLWWLHKTRKEHSATYQPYVSFKLDTTEAIKKAPAPDLNQQIIENIFHLQSPLEDIKEAEKPKTVEFTVKRKGEQIIERFIREEPQIRPPKPEKLDTENKARKSSEDSYEMVSETLANVYIEQMLFHKAIDTYKKLSLKFPEKSAYFADQIRKLETTN